MAGIWNSLFGVGPIFSREGEAVDRVAALNESSRQTEPQARTGSRDKDDLSQSLLPLELRIQVTFGDGESNRIILVFAVLSLAGAEGQENRILKKLLGMGREGRGINDIPWPDFEDLFFSEILILF